VRFSAFPINVVRGTDLNGDGINNDRPPFRGRNDTPGYGLKEVNLRIGRTFRFYERYSLELIREAENLLNSTNAACTTAGCTGALVNTVNARDFKRITFAPECCGAFASGTGELEDLNCVTVLIPH
jgi:hypothetical protein